MKKMNFSQLENLTGGIVCLDPSNGHWALGGCPGRCLALTILSGGSVGDPSVCL